MREAIDSRKSTRNVRPRRAARAGSRRSALVFANRGDLMWSMTLRFALCTALAAFSAACSSQNNNTAPSNDATAPPVAVDAATGDSSPFGDTSVSQFDAGETGLPTLPVLTNVVALQREDSVGIDFDPHDGAIDYR